MSHPDSLFSHPGCVTGALLFRTPPLTPVSSHSQYYTHTAFELVAESGPALGALGSSQGTVLAGGRYDGLVARLSGTKGGAMHAVGWAAGVERLDLVGQALATDAWLQGAPPPDVLVAAMDSDLTVQDAALMAAQGA